MESAGVIVSGISVVIEMNAVADAATDVDLGMSMGVDAVNPAAQAVSKNKKRMAVEPFVLIVWKELRFNGKQSNDVVLVVYVYGY